MDLENICLKLWIVVRYMTIRRNTLETSESTASTRLDVRASALLIAAILALSAVETHLILEVFKAAV